MLFVYVFDIITGIVHVDEMLFKNKQLKSRISTKPFSYLYRKFVLNKSISYMLILTKKANPVIYSIPQDSDWDFIYNSLLIRNKLLIRDNTKLIRLPMVAVSSFLWFSVENGHL